MQAALGERIDRIEHIGSTAVPGLGAKPVIDMLVGLRALADARGWKAGDLFGAIRVAITGRTATPPLFDTLVAMGYDRTLARLDAAIMAVAGMGAAGS